MSDFIRVCEKATREGGAILVEKYGRVEAREKGRADLVTEADFASQEAIRRTVLTEFPDHLFLGEEDEGTHGEPVGHVDHHMAQYCWIADPLDGTTNYVHQVPHFSVSLALVSAGEVLVGCIFNPMTDECFSAVAGRGAWLNGAPIRTSRVTGLSDALVSTGFPSVAGPESPDVRLFIKGLGTCQALRRTGSAALNLSYVAAGRFDAAWSFCTKIWDVAAGVLLIREAGGVVTAPDGGTFSLKEAEFIAAANGQLHDQLRAMVAETGL